MVAHACNFSYMGDQEVQGQLGQKGDPIYTKQAGHGVQVCGPASGMP
jgi:hypothetical protein